MTAEERIWAMCSWNALIVFASLFYLTGSFLKSAIVLDAVG